ncbi:MAG: ATP-binding protein [Bryobacteraceae bacterium]
MGKQRPFRSLAVKFCWFTAFLVGWAYTVEIAVHLLNGIRLRGDHLIISGLLVALAAVIARVTSRVFIRPLTLLNDAITSVKEGNLEPVRLSASGDEIERLGESFNEMIEALASSRRQVLEHQQHLEQKIRERTRALEESTARAEAASQAKSAFLANMSHELRTPLNGITGMLDIVLESDLDSTQRSDLETARASSLSLLALVNDILDMSKIEAGRLVLEKIHFSPYEVVRHCSKLLAARAKEKGLELTWLVQPEVPRFVIGDPLRLQQIVVNLLGNAIKYTPRGSVSLCVGSRPAQIPGAVQLRFDIVDTGIGIPPDKLSSIFEKFTQADESITRQYGGTGLGLSICKELVAMHGGRIWVESEVGRGSSFHVELELPVAPEPAAAAPEDLPPAGAKPVAAQILIVEDNPTNQKVVAGLLGKRGYRTHVAADGRQALEALEESPFDLVLMDLQMPVLDGLEATRLIRQDPRWRKLPIVGLTARCAAEDRERCLEAGMDDFLAKPVRPPVLLATVSRLLSERPTAAEASPTVFL